MTRAGGQGRVRWALALLVAAGLLLAGCGGDGVERDEFDLTASDGFVFPAEVSHPDDSAGATWLLLGHQFTGNRRDWDGLRDDFLDTGVTVMTWDFRCHGEATCETDTKGESVEHIWREWNAALDYAVEQGATTIYAAGASMGGTSLIQVAAGRSDIAALAAVSSPNRFKGLDALANYDRVTIPKFFVVGRADMAAPTFSRRYHERASGPSRLVVLETDLHGTTLVKDEVWGPQVHELLLDYFADPATAVTLASIDPGPLPEEDEQASSPAEESSDEPPEPATEQPAAEQQTPPQQEDEPETAEAPVAQEPRDLTLRTDDGLDLAATLWPAGSVWVLLGHQLRDSREGWGALDDQLHADGYTVLAWDFRDHGDSPSGDLADIALDWLAAIDFARDSGASAIYGIGASMGGTSLLTVAAGDPRLAGLATVSAPAVFLGLDGGAAVQSIDVPMLFIAGNGDIEALAGLDRFRRAAREAGLQHTAVTFSTSLHGNALVRDGALGREVYQHVRDLLPPAES